MKVRNVGIADLYVPFGMHDGIEVKQGSVAEVPDVIALGLLEQSIWEAVDAAPKAAPPVKPKKDGE